MKKFISLLLLFTLLISCDSPTSFSNLSNTDANWTKVLTNGCKDLQISISVKPEDDIQDIVESTPAGEVILLEHGRYRQQRITPKEGMIFIAAKPTATDTVVLDGENKTKFAFGPSGYYSPIPDRVTICGHGIIENYIPGKQMGAIKAGRHDKTRNSIGWIVDGWEIRNNDGAGIRTGHEMEIRNSFIHHNSQIGIAGSGDNIVVKDNEISHHNLAGKYDPKWEAGGTKLVMTTGLEVLNNYVHHNNGPGLWTDIDNRDTTYKGNLVEHNAYEGIFHEISFSALIIGNTVRYNGFFWKGENSPHGCGIKIANSENVDVTENTLKDNWNGFCAIHQDRSSDTAGNGGPYFLSNVLFQNNTVIQGVNSRFLAAVKDWTGADAYSRNIIFKENRYYRNFEHIKDMFKHRHVFRWGGHELRWKSWQNDYGHDLEGEFL